MIYCPNCDCPSCCSIRDADEAQHGKEQPQPTPPEGYRLVISIAIDSDHDVGHSGIEYAAVKTDTVFAPTYLAEPRRGEIARYFLPGPDTVVFSRSDWDGSVQLPPDSKVWGCGEWHPGTQLPILLRELGYTEAQLNALSQPFRATE